MGTRALLRVVCDNEDVIKMICDLDGEPAFFGRDLADFLLSIQVRNGRSFMPTQLEANGVGNLLVKVVAHFAARAGNFSLVPVVYSWYDQDWEYKISYQDLFDQQPIVHVALFDDEVFYGGLMDFRKFCDDVVG